MNIVLNLLAVVILVTLFCSAFSHPDVQRNQNQENFDAPVGLHQIEKEAVGLTPQDNLKRFSRKIECPFAKLKGAKSSSSSRGSKCPFSSKNPCPQKGYKIISSHDENVDMSGFITQFSFIVEELFIQMKALMDIMPIALDNIKNRAILVPGLIEDVEITSDSCAKTHKDLSGFFDFFGNIFKFSKSGSESYETEDFDLSGCLETIKEHLLGFLGFLKPCMKSSQDIYSHRISKIEKLLEHFSPSKFKSLSSVCVSPQRTIKYPSLFQKHSGSMVGIGDDSMSLTDQIHTLRELSVFMDQFPFIINEMMEAVKGVSQSYVQIKGVNSNTKTHSSGDCLWPHISYQPPNIKPVVPDVVQTYYPRPTFESTDFIRPIEPPRVIQIPPRIQGPSCSAQSIINQIAMIIASQGKNINLDLTNFSNVDLSGIKITLDRSTVKTILYNDNNLHAGDIVIINLTSDIMLVGAPTDNSSPIIFNIINRGVSHKSAYNYNTVIWNLSAQDFSCNQQIYSDVISDLKFE